MIALVTMLPNAQPSGHRDKPITLSRYRNPIERVPVSIQSPKKIGPAAHDSAEVPPPGRLPMLTAAARHHRERLGRLH
jgi:hypothetical protein